MHHKTNSYPLHNSEGQSLATHENDKAAFEMNQISIFFFHFSWCFLSSHPCVDQFKQDVTDHQGVEQLMVLRWEWQLKPEERKNTNRCVQKHSLTLLKQRMERERSCRNLFIPRMLKWTLPFWSTTVFVYLLKLPPCACPTTELMANLVFHTLLCALQPVGGKRVREQWVSEWMCVWEHGSEQQYRGEKGGALLYVGGLFRLGLCKLLHEHVENQKPFSSFVIPRRRLRSLCCWWCMWSRCCFFFLSSSPSSHSPPPLLTLVCLPALAVLPSPASSLLCCTCLHLAVQYMRRGCVVLVTSECVCMCVYMHMHKRAWASTHAVPYMHLPSQKHVVMSLTVIHTTTASQSRRLVLRPP